MLNQPTILVKKTDGTQVRMTMEEFRVYRTSQTSRTPNSDSRTPIVEPAEPRTPIAELQQPTADSHNLPMKEEEHELATTTPVKNIFVDEAVYTKTQKHKNTKTRQMVSWTSDDHRSPLEDKTEELDQHKDLGVLPDKKDDLYAQVLQKIKFPVPDDLQARLQSLITSRVKDVRSDEQFLAYVSKSGDSGGLGLTSEQSQELLAIVKDIWHLSQAQMKIKKTEIEKIPVTKPVSDPAKFKHPEISLPRVAMAEKPVLHDVVRTSIEAISVERSGNEGSSENMSVSPVEEIRSIRLIDLRRLGNSTDENFKKLLEKFKILKKDSIILYLQAVQAWQESPLYHQYRDMVRLAIENKVGLKNLAIGGENLSWDEVSGVVDLSNDL